MCEISQDAHCNWGGPCFLALFNFFVLLQVLNTVPGGGVSGGGVAGGGALVQPQAKEGSIQVQQLHMYMDVHVHACIHCACIHCTCTLYVHVHHSITCTRLYNRLSWRRLSPRSKITV